MRRFAIASLLLASSACALSAIGCSANTSDDPGADEDAADALSYASTPIDEGYTEGHRHSKLTADVIANLKEIRARGTGDPTHVMKVGDSITYSTSFLDCLGFAHLRASGKAPPALDGAGADLEETRAFFDTGLWERLSTTSQIGWHTTQPFEGDPTRLDREIGATKPAFIVLMMGTNDTYQNSQLAHLRNMTKLIDAITKRGIIPIVSTIPPRGDGLSQAQSPANAEQKRNRDADPLVGPMNDAIRRAASSRKVPLMDFHMALQALAPVVPARGISSDGIHPTTAPAGACDFSDGGLRYGYNQRNLLALEALDRMRGYVLADAPAER